MTTPQFQHVATQSEHLVVVTRIRAFGVLIEHMVEGQLGDLTVKPFRLRPSPKARAKSMRDHRLAGFIFPVAAAMHLPDCMNDRLVIDRMIGCVGKQECAALRQGLDKLDRRQ